ncbi:hypothetical protein HQ585_07135 [candidate division KSB1 bacterium]|nr:hypothetical protein [candidate division KSB1 bacterium]
MKKRILLIVVMILITLPYSGNSQTIQIGLSPSLSHVLGGSYYADELDMTLYEQGSLPWRLPRRHFIQALGLGIMPGYQVELKMDLNNPGVFCIAQFEQQFLSKTGKASLFPPLESSYRYLDNAVNVKVASSLIALNLGIGCRLQSKGPTPYLAGALLLSRIGDVTIKDDNLEVTIDETIPEKNRLGFSFIFGFEWDISQKLTLDTQLNLKNYAMWFREEDEDFFITTGLSIGVLYTLTSSNH